MATGAVETGSGRMGLQSRNGSVRPAGNSIWAGPVAVKTILQEMQNIYDSIAKYAAIGTGCQALGANSADLLLHLRVGS